MSEDNTGVNISRRAILRKTAAAGAASVTLASSSNPAAAEEDLPDINVVDKTELSDAEAQTELNYVMDTSAAQNLDQAMRAESNVKNVGQFGVAIETDDPKINKTDPVIVFSGYKSDDGTVGTLLSIVVDATPDAETSTREPMMAFGRTVEQSNETAGVTPATSSSSGFEMKTYTADEQGSVSVSQQESIQNSATQSSGVTPADWKDELGCGGCTAIVTQLCDKGTGTVSRTACLKACAPFLGSVWGYGACGAACIVIVDTVNDYGCAIGAAAICSKMGLC